MPQSRPVHPRVREMLASGQLSLPKDLDPADVSYVQFDAPPSPESGTLIIPACLVEPQYARVFTERVQTSEIVPAPVAPPTVVYGHCGRECARCTAVAEGQAALT